MLEKMIEKALAIRDKSYSPYSKFRVGACIRTSDNQLYAGTNVENASYSLVLCAESIAISGMAADAGVRKIEEVVVLSDVDDNPCPPCGACRQRLFEFGGEELKVHVCTSTGEIAHSYTLGELLPAAFGPSTMGIDIQ